ncbi:hypothetical protein, partial [Stenotrophomonas sp. Ste96]|uniref:hypothetical protein n=1 Tax=Stenotrophomonas sp. Ste96 TaxID=2926029 RepID=UPI0021C66158
FSPRFVDLNGRRVDAGIKTQPAQVPTSNYSCCKVCQANRALPSGDSLAVLPTTAMASDPSC